ncbi:MAG: long-chain fatty acid--CoA ligase [Myxococcales bacterium]|nr:long-chain fatty acid--CoA ligase [Myxococcales bacterium]
MKPTSNWLEMHARFRPDAEAVFDVDQGRRWTYAELHRESLCWAGRLQRAGVKAGDFVALLAQNRGECFALLFAVAELGAALFPMNWRLAPEELAWQLENCSPRVVLVDGSNRGVLRCKTMGLEEGPGDEPATGPGSSLDATWILMYTSGSSGRPKGAMLSHRQVHWNAVSTTLACDLAPSDSTLTFTPLFHTGGLNCLSTPLLHRGGRVVLTRGLDVAQALQLIAQEGITTLMGVPTIYQMLADHPDFEATDTSSVRDALCGGAPLSMPLLERYLARGIPLRQGFGMTEVGPNCFSMPHARLREKIESVGLPIHHVAARIVRADGSECGPDEPGELWLSGPAVFSGYLHNPEANAKSFVDGWFCTGDVLSRDAEGFFRVRGRLKEMFISGGENVYPAEVEAVILQAPGVGQVAVIGVADPRWGEVGHAYVEPAVGHTVDQAALLAFLNGKLARFKIPKGVTVMELPRTASGKIDKPALARLHD